MLSDAQKLFNNQNNYDISSSARLFASILSAQLFPGPPPHLIRGYGAGKGRGAGGGGRDRYVCG